MYNKRMLECANCQRSLKGYQKKYCSNTCQKDFEHNQYIKSWINSETNGSRGLNTRNFSKHVVRYLHEKYNESCSKCGWNERNPVTNSCPLEIDHIDGNADNNSESNLQLLCPNCHSLTSTYKNLNYGYGRGWRREKYVKIGQVPL